MAKISILVFGVGKLQKSIIRRAKAMGLYVVGIDPNPNAECRHEVDAFEVVAGQDYEGTLAVAKKHNVKAVVTAATDKPLVMMARIAETLALPFYSTETAIISTDKLRMKECFLQAGIPCARGITIRNIEDSEGLHYPVILKPRDNSGSRGVILCKSKEDLAAAFEETKSNTRLDSVLAEEFIEGQEYSIEALHYGGTSKVIQFTEKETTPFPYNVELSHIQPACLSNQQRNQIEHIIEAIGKAMKFENCPSHTELKINDRGIFVIETSPRLGGDYITSELVPLSTDCNMEDALILISLGKTDEVRHEVSNKAASVRFFSLPEGKVSRVNDALSQAAQWPGVVSFECGLKAGDTVPRITNSLDRYGQLIVQGETREEVDLLLSEYTSRVSKYITVKEYE